MPRFVRDNGTNSKKRGTRGRKPASKKLVVRFTGKPHHDTYITRTCITISKFLEQRVAHLV